MNGQTSSVSLDLRLEPMRMKEVNQKSYPDGGDKWWFTVLKSVKHHLKHIQKYDVVKNLLKKVWASTRWIDLYNTVDGRNPAPPGIYKILVNNRMNYQPQLVQGFWTVHSIDFLKKRLSTETKSKVEKYLNVDAGLIHPIFV